MNSYKWLVNRLVSKHTMRVSGAITFAVYACILLFANLNSLKQYVLHPRKQKRLLYCCHAPRYQLSIMKNFVTHHKRSLEMDALNYSYMRHVKKLFCFSSIISFPSRVTSNRI